MGQRVWKILLGMIFACVVLGESGSVTAANAQNADLIAKLATLTLRKGTPLPLGSTAVAVDAPETKGEVAEEISYWRTQQAQLANEPDRKD